LEYQYFKQDFHNCNTNLAVMDFRGYGFSTGSPYFSCLYEDAMPIYNHFIEWIKDNGFSDSIFVMGRSLGSFCAAEIGSHNPPEVRGMIFESGIGSTYKIMKYLFRINIPQIDKDSLDEWSNDTRVSKFKKPTLIIHGTSDWIVPVEHAHVLYESIPNDVYKKLILIEGAGHNNIFQFGQEYFNPLKDFINKFK
ncbi:MAG: alpha/beta hydrolase family protein, partial [Candidatus Helarchaeota archaeon]